MNLYLKTFLFACLGGSTSIHADAAVEESEQPEFFAWAKQHSKTYPTDDETMVRLGIWKKNNGEYLYSIIAYMSYGLLVTCVPCIATSNLNIAAYFQLQTRLYRSP